MAELKTKLTKASPTKFIDSIADAEVRADCKRIATIMKRATGGKAEMWGPSIVGFGRYQYMGASGRGGEWMQLGFSPRKTAITLYLTTGFGKLDDLLDKLGKHSRSAGGCLYVKRLSDVSVPTLERLLKASVKRTREIEKARMKS